MYDDKVMYNYDKIPCLIHLIKPVCVDKVFWVFLDLRNLNMVRFLISGLCDKNWMD